MRLSEKDRETTEILHMQERIFRMALKKWKVSIERCNEIFDMLQIDNYIRDVYGIFHVQGDEANLLEIDEYRKAKGVEI